MTGTASLEQRRAETLGVTLGSSFALTLSRFLSFLVMLGRVSQTLIQ